MQLPFVVRRATEPIDVVALGENSLDFVGTVGATVGDHAGKRTLDQFHLQPGGQMATAAVACARLGVRTRYIGAFGGDEWGRRARAPLVEAGVEVVSIARGGVPGRIAVILVDASGGRRIYEHRDPALVIEPGDIAVDAIAPARVLLVDATCPAAARHAVRLARRSGAITIVDADRPSPDVDRLLREIDVVVLPESFVMAATGAPDLDRGLTAMSARCPNASVVIATRGESGSVALCRGTLIATPAFDVDVRDTTGAGDAFRAGLAAALVSSDNRTTVEDVLRFASAVAALNCRALGAQTGLPSLAEVHALLARAGAGQSRWAADGGRR